MRGEVTYLFVVVVFSVCQKNFCFCLVVLQIMTKCLLGLATL